MLIGVDHGNKQIKTVHGEPFVTAAEPDPAVRPEPAILWYLLHTVQ